MKRITMVFGLLVVGAFAAQLLPERDSQVVYAQCTTTVHGKNISTTGTLVCDCTIHTGENCDCVVSTKCPGGDDDLIE